MTTFLDQLAGEWYALKDGYYVSMNVRLRKRKTGGRVGDADVIGIPPVGSKLKVIHIEASQAAHSLSAQMRVFTGKFNKAADDYVQLTGVEAKNVRKIAIGGWAKAANEDTKRAAQDKGFEVFTVPEFVKIIADDLKQRDAYSNSVPETFPMLRAINNVLWFGLEKEKNPRTKRNT